MSAAGAQSAIVLSAFVVAGIYAWRWLTGERHEAKLSPASLVSAPLVSPEGFLVAWGVVYFLLAATSAFAPALAGAMALFVLLVDAIANLTTIGGKAAALEQAKAVGGTTTTTHTKGRA